MNINDTTIQKYEELKADLSSMGRVAVAFSGGVDSALLLAVAHDVLGEDSFAVTVRSCLFPEREICEASEFCELRGIEQVFIDIDIDEIDGITVNPQNRCYFCKKHLMGCMKRVAEDRNAVLVEGSNMDDLSDYRPGAIAVSELGVASPLQEAALYKSEIRTLSSMLELPTAGKQSFACLATRIPYGEALTKKKLSMVDSAEQVLADLGFSSFRVRAHGNVARIEVPRSDFDSILKEDVSKQIYGKFKNIGFDYTALDVLGYRMGSTNDVLGYRMGSTNESTNRM